MGFKCGIVGLPNVGKSTLFNALTASKNAEAANFPFCTIDPNIGIVDVIDERFLLEAQENDELGKSILEFDLEQIRYFNDSYSMAELLDISLESTVTALHALLFVEVFVDVSFVIVSLVVNNASET